MLGLEGFATPASRGSVMSSGTVGGALEGAIGGRKAVAVSFPFFSGWDNWTDTDINTAVRVGPCQVLHSLLRSNRGAKVLQGLQRFTSMTKRLDASKEASMIRCISAGATRHICCDRHYLGTAELMLVMAGCR